MTIQLTPSVTSLEKTLKSPPPPCKYDPLQEVREPVVFEQGKRVFKFWKIKTHFTDEKGMTFTVYQRDDLIPKTEDNRQRMQEGKAPLGIDGQKIELHHLTQNYGGALAEVTRYIHNEGRLPNGTPYTDILHGCPPKKLKDYYALWVSILTQPLKKKDSSKKKRTGLSKTKSKEQKSKWFSELVNKGLEFNLNLSAFNPVCGRREEFKEQKRAYWIERSKALFGDITTP